MRVLEILVEVGDQKPVRTTVKLCRVGAGKVLVRVDPRPERDCEETVHTVRDWRDAFLLFSSAVQYHPDACTLADLTMRVVQD